MIKNNSIILTLDAGGTNFVFSALQHGKIISDTVQLPASTKTEVSSTETISKGFELLKNNLHSPISAISFAFPGPADYSNGIIGDLPNFPGINGDYPLKLLLKKHFNCPVFINNDGNLFAYGEALSGALLEINETLNNNGNPKRFSNIIGITLGTGIGSGIVINGTLLKGDNSSEAEIHNMSNLNNPNWNIEESVSTRAIQRVYSEVAKIELDSILMPKDIFEIAQGNTEGNQEAAISSFNEYGKALGYVISDIITLIDGLVVIGGGITAAWKFFAPALFEAMQSQHQNSTGKFSKRTTIKVFNLESDTDRQTFLKGNVKNIQISRNSSVIYDTMSRTAIMRSKNGASVSTSLGAYYYALSQLNSKINNKTRISSN